jgi:hypothetical protein
MDFNGESERAVEKIHTGANVFRAYIDVIVNNLLGRITALIFIFFNLTVCTGLVIYLILPDPIYNQWIGDLEFKKPDMNVLVIFICITFAVLTLLLWVFHAIGLIKFEDKWIFRSIYGVAISAILGTTVSIYSNAVAQQNKKPLEGLWHTEYHFLSSFIDAGKGEIAAENNTFKRIYSSALVNWNSEKNSYEAVIYGDTSQIVIQNLSLSPGSVKARIYLSVVAKKFSKPEHGGSDKDKVSHLSLVPFSRNIEFNQSKQLTNNTRLIELERKVKCFSIDQSSKEYLLRNDLICELKLSRDQFK